MTAPPSQGWCPAQRHGGEEGVWECRPMMDIMSPAGAAGDKASTPMWRSFC